MVRIRDATFYNMTPYGSGAVEAMFLDKKTPRIVRDDLELTIFWNMTGPTKATSGHIR